MTSTPLRYVVAALAGVAIWTSFPPLGAWPIGVVGVAALALVLRQPMRWRQVCGLGYVSGLGLWIPMMSFLRSSYGIEAWAAVAIGESIWFLLLGVALKVALRTRWWPATTALMWVGQEFLRDRVPFDGFPWARLAFGQANGPLVRLASVGGAPLVTFAVALAGGLLAYGLVQAGALRFHAAGPAPRTVVAALGVAALMAGPLAIHLPTGGTSRNGSPSSVTVAAIQGNVPRLGLDAFSQKLAVVQDHLNETLLLAKKVAAGQLKPPKIVVWPENSDDIDPRLDEPDNVEAHQMITEAAQAVGVPILVGAVLDDGPTHDLNTGIVWSPTTGPGEIYVKRHLVPFGEYLPFRSILTKIAPKFKLIGKDFAPGHKPGTMTIANTKIADVICFEVADDTVVRQAVTGGGRLIVVQTNNASYENASDSGHGGETAQQLAMAQLRAVEHGRAVVVAATSGVSAMIAPNGKILERTGIFTPAILDRTLPLRDPLTIADRVGPWPEWVMSAAAFLAFILSLPRRRSRSRQETLDVDLTVAVSEPV